MRKRRLDKKLHKLWLHMGVVDASQNSYWRKKLFEAEEYSSFPIDSENCNGLWAETVVAIKKYKLRYFVAKVPPNETESWLREEGAVIFKFWPQQYPEVIVFSGNNPIVV
ncbi:MAG TPA: hypothetical protein DCS87_03415 [Rheinheimera sp.]|nr:hypothetical protein [Rheinheimera sp.]